MTSRWFARPALVLSLGLFAFIFSCAKDDELTSLEDTAATQVGDIMASIDEIGGENSSYAMLDGERKVMAKMMPDSLPRSIAKTINMISSANAASCLLGNTWGTCTSNIIKRTFNNCTIGAATLSGSVTLTYDDANNSDNTCSLSVDGNSILHVPDYSIKMSGATYTVKKTGVGQRLTRQSAGVFKFANYGIRRTFSFGGATLADYSTATTADITVTGAARTGRVMDGGTLRVTNNKNAEYCEFTPANVTWSASCTCPTSGSWSATCSNSKTGTLAITACGEGTYTFDGEESSVDFERCSSI